MKILYINEHTISNFTDRSNGLLESYIREDNDNNNLKIMYGYESRPNGKEFIKPILVVRNKWFLPLRIFEKDGIEYYKILSVLYETQYFASINLNFGIHTKPKNIRFNIIECGESFFGKSYNYIDIAQPFENFDWQLNTTEENPDKIIDISNKLNDRKNKVLKDKSLPFRIKTFKGKVIELI